MRVQKRLTTQEYQQGILAGNRLVLSRAITLAESTLAADKAQAREVLEGVLHKTGNSVRIGITGVPGVGKSTFIETFGKQYTALGHKLAVLAIDPTSQRTGGSILGDKTRMEQLSVDPLAYIRPSPAGASLGGVTNATRQAMLLCEAAGFDTIFIETVGVGQSETSVHGMTDFFLLLMLAGAGDELQGIKRGIMEMADALVITKADGENKKKAIGAKADYQSALHLFPMAESGWSPKVSTCSALTGDGITHIASVINDYVTLTKQNGYFSKQRNRQQLNWLHEAILHQLEADFFTNANVKANLQEVKKQVSEGKLSPFAGAEKLLVFFKET